MVEMGGHVAWLKGDGGSSRACGEVHGGGPGEWRWDGGMGLGGMVRAGMEVAWRGSDIGALCGVHFLVPCSVVLKWSTGGKMGGGAATGAQSRIVPR